MKEKGNKTYKPKFVKEWPKKIPESKLPCFLTLQNNNKRGNSVKLELLS